MKISSLCLASLPLTAAFVPQGNNGAAMTKNSLQAESVSTLPSPTKPIFDPLGLYADNSPERMAGLIKPLESSEVQYNKEVQDPLGLYPSYSQELIDGIVKASKSSYNKDVVDPLRLYQDTSQVSSEVQMSASLPFLPRPAMLDGTLPGDRGFDPLNFASDASALQWQRKAEVKHARLAMLAAVGWPAAELLHKDIASTFDLPILLASGDRVPSILNDGLSHASFPAFWIAIITAAAVIEIQESVEAIYDGLSHASFPAFWIAIITAAAVIEIQESVEANLSCKLNPADKGFDPINLGGKTMEQKHFMHEAELFNGRLGMLAITGFAIQEWFLNSAVVDQIPIFFKPLNVAMEQLMNA
eukprot:CAMPEP_0201986728 /NCGR_PEP_ID=MMETSP0904-20121228/91423_1 /ASSEMBLY_ACC=CAM_ASM_000553 /TAXON_ID=420261 /ORGANISM="Thalassiosira antarctica, Strain CCMP982" /LENGTH=357 /DNA_ID=CAMNT_0048540799 /DNA_START=278 /DNA_END=1352 /DNA_ORIENTATION=-